MNSLATDRRQLLQANEAIHGFALLTFSGPTLTVDCIDEFGDTWFSERLA